MSKPKRCKECQWHLDFYIKDEQVGGLCTITEKDDKENTCPLIEIDDELIKKLQESAIVIKAVFNRLKKVVNNSDELKTELMGTNPNLTIFDECVESFGK